MEFSEFSGTDYAAVWGALVGSFVLMWDILKWVKDGPRLKLSVRPNTFYNDGEVLSIEKHENGESKTLASYYHIEIVNRGTLPTTLLGIEASTRPVGIFKLFNRKKMIVSQASPAFTPHYGKNMPYIINPGEVWSCRIRMSRIKNNGDVGWPKLFVYISHKDKPIVGDFKKFDKLLEDDE